MDKLVTICDFDEHEPDDDVRADHKRTFMAAGQLQVIDLCESCRPKFEAFQTLSERWNRCSRPVEEAAPAKRERATRPRVRTDNSELRAWAREQGIDLGDRGRIAEDVRAQYEAWKASRNGHGGQVVSLSR